MKLNALKFAISAGITLAICFVITTISAILNVPGYDTFAIWLESIYGAYGYSVSSIGILIGGIYGFIEGFVWFGLFALIYNKLIGEGK
jgi:hypothetical protein